MRFTVPTTSMNTKGKKYHERSSSSSSPSLADSTFLFFLVDLRGGDSFPRVAVVDVVAAIAVLASPPPAVLDPINFFLSLHQMTWACDGVISGGNLPSACNFVQDGRALERMTERKQPV